MRQLDNALAEAQACATSYGDTPEWQRITRVSHAARALLAAIRETAGDYWAEVRQDIRVRGFARTVTARASRAVAGAAHALAARLEHSGHHQSRAWRAAHELDRAASSFADRLMRYLQPGSPQRMRDVAQIIEDLGHPPQDARQPGAFRSSRPPAHPASAAAPSALTHASFPGPLSQVTRPRETPETARRTAAHAAAGAQQPSRTHR